MNLRFSLYLDFLRFTAAMIVFFSHFAYPRFTDGDYVWARELNIGSDAVVFFFVLSGLVIAYTTDVKDKDLKQYSFNRFTRLFSVIVPALLLTIILDEVGRYLNPQNYEGFWYALSPIWEQLLRGLTLSTEWAHQGFRIGSNGPYWSLSYEAAYYVLFGIAFYMTGIKRALLLCFLIPFFGLPVLLLFPAWLLGVWVYKQIQNNILSPVAAWSCTLVPPLLYILFLLIGLPGITLILTKLALSPEFVDGILRFSDEFVWNLIIAALVAFHLIGMAALTQGKEKTFSQKIRKAIRWCAGATFTIYIVHYPLLQFTDTVLPNSIDTSSRHIALFSIVLIACFVFAELSERRLKWLRKKLQKSE